jgi:hypothetical protein
MAPAQQATTAKVVEALEKPVQQAPSYVSFFFRFHLNYYSGDWCKLPHVVQALHRGVLLPDSWNVSANLEM